MQRASVDDIREVMAYYKMQSEDRAQEQWKTKLDQLEKKKKGNGMKVLGR